jgi:hypothetical protein
VPGYRANLKNRRCGFNLNENDKGRCHGNWRRRVEHDAKRAIVGIGAHRMHVRDLHKGQQRQQGNADQHHREGAWLRAEPAPNLRWHADQNTIPALRIHRIRCEETRDVILSLKIALRTQPTSVRALRLNCWAMNHFSYLRRLVCVAIASLSLLAAIAVAQQKKPLTVKPDAPGLAKNHRLILKDGSYQMVREYHVVGDRVRYISLERTGEWEELPANLVDWDATNKWERDHATQAEEASPAMKEAEDIDKEESAERLEQKYRMPIVAKGLELPDEDGVFALDTFEGSPELVELIPSELGLNAKNKHGLSTLNPLAGSKADLELEGQRAKIHLHVNDPAIYLSLDAQDNAEKVLSHAMTVETRSAKEIANRKHGAHSPASGFAIVHVDQRKEVRIVGAIHVSPTGSVTQDEDVIPTKVEVLEGKHWLKLTPQKPLTIGEYALVEILSASDINQSVWDFRVDPQLGDNPGSLGPIFK